MIADIVAGGGHEPVLLQEAIEVLAVRPDGVYLDGTFGRGGHAAGILERLGEHGRLLAVDKDPQAAEVARMRFATDRRFTMARGSFALFTEVVEQQGVAGRIDGILLDLGLSSPQLDDASRGFSFSHDGPLDMRMDPDTGVSAAQWLASADEQDIARIIKSYGEERFARRIARAIVAARQEAPIDTTARLADLVARAIPHRERHKHPATRTFQAIRIFINRELDDLADFLVLAPRLLGIGGRLAVISFHSLEDRLVKRAFRPQAPSIPRRMPVRGEVTTRVWKSLGKPVRPSADECRRNPRARSAVLRAAERVS